MVQNRETQELIAQARQQVLGEVRVLLESLKELDFVAGEVGWGDEERYGAKYLPEDLHCCI